MFFICPPSAELLSRAASAEYVSNNPAELYAVLAVPKVIKRGIEIHGHENHKYRGFLTVTFAAPVEINGVRGNMGVVVKLMDKKRYKTHRILLPDGSVFVYETKNAEPTPAGGAANGPHAQRISSAIDIITQKAPESNSASICACDAGIEIILTIYLSSVPFLIAGQQQIPW